MRPTVLLFDIDGTLITTGNAGRRSIERAFAELHGRGDACNFSLSGMTDRAIVRKALVHIGVTVSEDAIDAVIERYLENLAHEVPRVAEADYRVFPGMREAVEAAVGLERVAVGLGTGNVVRGAQLKLERVGLYRHFSFGGFGSDAEDRTELIRVGASKGARRLGVPVEACRVVVIGDTPKDVDAALGAGAECIGVGTGNFRAEALRAAGAHVAFDDFSAPGALDALLQP